MKPTHGKTRTQKVARADRQPTRTGTGRAVRRDIRERARKPAHHGRLDTARLAPGATEQKAMNVTDDLAYIQTWLGERAKPRPKYGARPVVVDGIRFASQREANRYGELKLLERAGKIRDLTLQPAFALHVRYAGPPNYINEHSGAPLWTRAPVLPAEQQIGIYRADFAYATDDGTVIEDSKGFRTPLYRWKKKHVEAEYGVRIVEV